MSARARCSAGAAGCWADAAGDAFLSFELNALAPRLAFTTVWLNCSSQVRQVNAACSASLQLIREPNILSYIYDSLAFAGDSVGIRRSASAAASYFQRGRRTRHVSGAGRSAAESERTLRDLWRREEQC